MSYSSKTLKTRFCFCGATSVEPVAIIPYQDVIETDTCYFHEVVICEECGFVFASHSLNEDALYKYYQKNELYNDSNTNLTQSSGLQKKAQQQLKFTLKHIKKEPFSLLDIGCSVGTTLNHFNKNANCICEGLDPSQICSTSAKEQFGIDVKVGNLLEISKSIKKKFDVVSMSHVFEHLDNLNEALTAVKTVLRADGLLYIEVPSAEHFTGHTTEPFGSFSFEHLNFFTKTSLRYLMSLNNFIPVDIEIFSNSTGIMPHYPVLATLWRKAKPDEIATLLQKKPNKPSEQKNITQYVSCTQDTIDNVNTILSSLLGKKVAIWGAGTHTSRLFALTKMRDLNIECIFDSMTSKHGTTLLSIPVISPKQINTIEVDAIIISSYSCMNDIYNQIVETAPNQTIIKLYNK